MGHVPRSVQYVTNPDQLPERQRQVLALLAAGKSDKAIAQELGIATQTVKNQLTAIYRRLPIERAGTRRTAAAVWFLRFVGGERPPSPPDGG